MFASLADGVSQITGCLRGEDVRCTMGAFRAMGVRILETADGKLEISGVGVDGLQVPHEKLDMGIQALRCACWPEFSPAQA